MIQCLSEHLESALAIRLKQWCKSVCHCQDLSIQTDQSQSVTQFWRQSGFYDVSECWLALTEIML